MIELETLQTVPMAMGEDGTIHIGKSRVALDSVLAQFKQGATAEQIQHDFPSLSLGQVYGAIAYYLEHTEPIESYLKQQQQAAEEVRRLVESQMDSSALRQRLLLRRAQS